MANSLTTHITLSPSCTFRVISHDTEAPRAPTQQHSCHSIELGELQNILQTQPQGPTSSPLPPRWKFRNLTISCNSSRPSRTAGLPAQQTPSPTPPTRQKITPTLTAGQSETGLTSRDASPARTTNQAKDNSTLWHPDDLPSAYAVRILFIVAAVSQVIWCLSATPG
ncbi:hypothetical protein BGX38DRAFT_1197068 [Terfezia claveryi]|nr:hypothetical protein BGX38DRAFT_1197068 [Terfezia claveryi]